MAHASSRPLAGLALGLIVVAANLGMIVRFGWPSDGGQTFFVITRVWMLLLPVMWVWRVDRRRMAVTWPSRLELKIGWLLGWAMLTIIYGGYVLVGHRWLEPTVIRERVATLGLLNPQRFLGFAIYFTFVNALVEEYLWRWFVYRKCELLVSGVKAVMLAALCFTLHHIVALIGFTGDWRVVVFGSIGVFGAGAVWSWCYWAYRSLWACYISHALADLAIAIVAWQILFT